MGCKYSKSVDNDNNLDKQLINYPMLITESKNNHEPISIVGQLVSDNNHNSNNINQSIFNLNNLNRWRGLENFKFNSVQSNGSIIATTPTIKHCIQDIQINIVKYSNSSIQVSISLSENIFNQLETDIRSLSNNSLTTLYCKTEYDLIDALKSLEKIIPEMTDVNEILIKKYPVFKQLN